MTPTPATTTRSGVKIHSNPGDGSIRHERSVRESQLYVRLQLVPSPEHLACPHAHALTRTNDTHEFDVGLGEHHHELSDLGGRRLQSEQVYGQRKRRLPHRLEQNHTGRHRIIREVAGIEELALSERVLADNVLLVDLQDPVDEDERGSLWNELEYLRRSEHQSTSMRKLDHVSPEPTTARMTTSPLSR